MTHSQWSRIPIILTGRGGGEVNEYHVVVLKDDKEYIFFADKFDTYNFGIIKFMDSADNTTGIYKSDWDYIIKANNETRRNHCPK